MMSEYPRRVMAENPVWITNRRPTEADGNHNGAVRIRKYPDKMLGANVHWTYVGCGVPWVHADDWDSSQSVQQEKVLFIDGQHWLRTDGKIVTLREEIQDVFTDGEWYYDQGSQQAPGTMANVYLVRCVESSPAEEEASAPILRTFSSISRTYIPPAGGYIIDAIANDGTAWFRIVEIGCDGKWIQQPALPQG